MELADIENETSFVKNKNVYYKHSKNTRNAPDVRYQIF